MKKAIDLNRIRGAVFDVDGTLLDSMHVWDTAASDYVRAQGIVPPIGLDDKLAEVTIEEAAAYFRNVLGIEKDAAEVSGEINEMIRKRYAENVMVKKGVPGLLKKLKDNGIALVISTISEGTAVQGALEHNGIAGYFSGMATAAEVGSGKDRPEIFDAALSLLGTKKEETLLFEDALYAIKTASQAGYRVVGVYDEASEENRSEIQSICEAYLSVEEEPFRFLSGSFAP